MHNADDTAAQFFGAAVVGDKDMVMSASFRPKAGKVQQFRAVFRHHTDTLVWQECPATATH